VDENKFKMLKRVSYRILKTCRTCIYSHFAPATEWGTCSLWHYHHLKHDEVRDLSIHICGGCPSWKMDKTGLLGGFAELLINDVTPTMLGSVDPGLEKKLRAEWEASGDLVYCEHCGKQVIVGMDHDCTCTRCGGAGEKPLPCPVCGKIKEGLIMIGHGSKAHKLKRAVLKELRELLATQPATRAAILGMFNEYTDHMEKVVTRLENPPRRKWQPEAPI